MKRTLVVLGALAILATPAGSRHAEAGQSTRRSIRRHRRQRIELLRAQRAHSHGNPPVGVAYYRIDTKRDGRVAIFHIVINDKTRRTGDVLKRLVTGRELPADAPRFKAGSTFRPRTRTARSTRVPGWDVSFTALTPCCTSNLAGILPRHGFDGGRLSRLASRNLSLGAPTTRHYWVRSQAKSRCTPSSPFSSTSRLSRNSMPRPATSSCTTFETSTSPPRAWLATRAA